MRTMIVLLALLAAGTVARALRLPVSYDYPWCLYGGTRLFRRLLL